MAQPTQFIFKYTNAVAAKSGTAYLGSNFQILGNILQMKTKGVSVSINGSPMFLTSFDDLSYLDNTTTYIFDKDCIIAIGSMQEVV